MQIHYFFPARGLHWRLGFGIMSPMKTQIRMLLAVGAIAALPAFADPSAEYVSERFEQQGEIGNYDVSVTLPKGAFVKFDGRKPAGN